MREIKFRVYQTKFKHWVDPCGIKISHKLGDNIFVPGALIPKENWAITQFTGLLDKNEKEIYEGDVISADAEWNLGLAHIASGEVVFNGGCFMVECEMSNQEQVYRLNEVFEIQVIGNIYENPKLVVE